MPTPEEIDQLEQRGLISPATAEQFRSGLTPNPTAMAYGDSARGAIGAAKEVPGASEPLVKDGFAPSPRIHPADATPAASPEAPGGGAGGGDYGMGAAQRGIGQMTGDYLKKTGDLAGNEASALGREKGAIERQTAAEVDQAGREARAIAERNRQIDEAQAQRQERESARKQVIDDEMKRFDALKTGYTKEADAGPPKETMGQKIGAAIAMALGTYASAFGVPNTAAQIVQQAAQERMQLYRDRLAAKRGAIADQKESIQMLGQRHDAERHLEAAVEMDTYERAKRKLEEISAGSKDQTVMANAEKLGAQFDQKIAQVQRGVFDQAYDKGTHALAAQAEIGARRGNLEVQREEAGTKAAAAAAKGRAGTIPGYAGTAPDEQSGHKAREIAGGNNATQRMIADITDDIDKLGTEVFPTSAAEALQTKALMLQTSLRKSGAMGTLDKGSQDFLNKMVGGDMTGFRTDKVKAKLKAIADSSRLQSTAELEAYGFRPEQDAVAEQLGGRPH